MSYARASSHGRGGKPASDPFDYDFFESPRADSSAKRPVSSRRDRRRRDSDSESSSGSDSYSSTESTSESESEDNQPERERVKIHANIPTVSLNDRYSDDSEDEAKSGRNSKCNRRSASGKENNIGGDTSKDRVRSRQKSATENGRRQRSDSGSRSRSRSRERKDGNTYAEDSLSDTVTDSSSESDITDVSPLTSPRNKKSGRKIEFGETVTYPYGPTKPPISPMQRDRPKSGRATSSGRAESYEKILDADKDTMNLKLLMRAIMEMENETGSTSKRSGGSSMSSRSKRSTLSTGRMGTQTLTPTSRERKNLSFRNDQVREIDMENQRLMQEILKCASAVKKQKKIQKARSQPAASGGQGNKLTTSAINRMREQRRIEEENQSMLRRLEGTRPTSTVKRDELLRDFDNSLLYGVTMGSVHPNKRPSKKSPYDIPVTGQDMRSASVSSMRSDATYTRPMSGKSRPTSAKSRPGSAKSATRPTSAKSSASSIGTGRPSSGKLRDPQYPSRPQSGKMQPVRPAWQD